MKLRWLIFCQTFLFCWAFFSTVAEHKGHAAAPLANRPAGQGLEFFLTPKAAKHFRQSELIAVHAGLLPQGARQTGHFGVLMEFADHGFILAHKGPKQYAGNPLNMLRLIASGMQQRVEILQFKNRADLQAFAEAIGWRFAKVEVEDPAAVKMAFAKELDQFYTQPNQWLYSLVKENCMMFGIDLIAAGKPIHWSRSEVFSIIPAAAFANILAAQSESIL